MVSDVQQLRKRVQALTTVQHIAQELMSELDDLRLLHKILNAAVQVLNADTGSLLIWVPPDHLEFAVSPDKDIVGQRMPADQGIAGWVFTHEKPLIVGDVSKDGRWFQEMAPGFETQSLIAVPLMTPTERIGVIEVLNKKSGEYFDQEDRDILSALAAQAATAIVNARLYQELEAEKNRILEIEDQTHKKLARDLHDGPAQALASMIMDLEFLQRVCAHEPQRVPEELSKLRERAARTLDQVRTTMFVLRPVVLETQGLRAALASYVERLRMAEGLDIQLSIRGLDRRLPQRIEEACFAVIHEAINNVHKHAHSANAWIVVERRARDLIVAIRDNGKGFDLAQTEARYDRLGKLGMLNMRERAEALDARYRVESVPGHGTLVYLIVPLRPEELGPEELGPKELEGEEREGQKAAPGREEEGREHSKLATGSERPPRQVRSAFLSPSRGRRRKGTGPLNLFVQGNPASDPTAR
jgi:signal transduction histidine kinase